MGTHTYIICGHYVTYTLYALAPRFVANLVVCGSRGWRAGFTNVFIGLQKGGGEVAAQLVPLADAPEGGVCKPGA